MGEVENPPAFPTERIQAFCRELEPSLEAQVRRFCDAAYEEIMVSVQEYLADNEDFNIKSRFDAQQQAVIDGYNALAAVESALDMQEAKANAYAARKGYWTAKLSAEYRAEAETRHQQWSEDQFQSKQIEKDAGTYV